MRSTCILGTVLLALGLIPGCAPGYNSVVFATKSNLGLDANIGIDADIAPANLEIAVSRHEGVLMPTFEGGQTVPVMASFLSESNAFKNFFWGVKSTFATGEAAYTMSDLYGDRDADTQRVNYQRVELSQMPDPKLPFGCKVDYVTAGKVQPVLFGTDTILGIKVKWSGQTVQYPSLVNIGFKRKEAAWAPIGVREKRNPQSSNPDNAASKQTEGRKPDNTGSTSFEVDVPSLLATVDIDFTAEGSAKFDYLQYFATGSAANNLARRQAVRLAMLKRADPTQNLQAAEAEVKQAATNKPLINQITAKFDSFKDDNKKQGLILAEAQRLNLVGAKVQVANFTNQLAANERKPSPVPENLQKLWDFAKGLQ